MTGLIVAFLYAAIPTHWLPFVVAARGQGWSRMRTLGVVGLAGAGHVLFTTLLRALLVFAGMQVEGWVGSLFARIAGGALILIGTFYLWSQWRGGEHGHAHLLGGHDHNHHERGGVALGQVNRSDLDEAKRSDRAVILGLIALLTFSPCEGFLPVYGAGIVFGWWGFMLLSGALALATIAAMMLFTWLTLLGVERLNLGRVERWEAAAYGVLFIGLGLLVLVAELRR